MSCGKIEIVAPFMGDRNQVVCESPGNDSLKSLGLDNWLLSVMSCIIRLVACNGSRTAFKTDSAGF